MSRPKLAAAALLLLPLVAYLPALAGGFVWDDDVYLADNVLLKAPGGLQRIWLEPAASPQYYPLVFSSFWVESRLWGFWPPGYHAVNILLHALNAVLLWLLLRRLGVPGAWLAAAIFALHPVHVESVAWVQERKNVLSGLFYLAAFLAFLRFALPEPVTPASPPPRLGRRSWYVLALLLGLAALLSKTATCTLPAALVLVLWWQRGRLLRRDVVTVLPLFGLAAGLGLVTVWVETHKVGARGPDWDLAPAERLLIAGRALWFYAGKLAWPLNLTFIYPRWQVDASAAGQYLFPLAALAVLAALALARKRLGSGPLVACLFFAGTLMPTLGFFNVYFMLFSFVADHFQYLASIGLIALAAALGAAAFRLLRLPRFAGPVAGGAVLVVLGVLTWRQAQVYKDQERLWEDTLAKNPTCWLAHNNLGTVLRDRKRPREALPHFQAAIRLRPQYSLARYNLGTELQKQGRWEEAVGELRALLEIDPVYPQAHFAWGTALAGQGRFNEAAEQFTAELRLDPGCADAYFNLGSAHYRQQRLAEAVASYRQAVELKPRAVEYRLALARTLEEQGDQEAAEAQLRAAHLLEQRP
jgi:protein O-mannosyl-transferase